MLVHTASCKKMNERIEREQREYEKRWPNYCRTCGATGMQCYQFDPSPAGVALSGGTMTECDPCEGDSGWRQQTEYVPGTTTLAVREDGRGLKTHPIYIGPKRPCVADGYCPRCAAPALVEYHGYDDAACSNCGWREGKSPGAPPPGECICPEPEPPDDWPPW